MSPLKAASFKAASFKAAVPLAALLCLAACGGKAATGTPAAAPTAVTTVTPTPASTTGGPGPTPTTARSTATTAAADWPSPADCVSYNPSSLAVHYEAGVIAVFSGSISVVSVQGGPTDTTTGQKLLALAQHYKRHCFLGRGKMYQDTGDYVFDYWRDPSGVNTPIPGQEDDCSPYNRNNLTVEDMGGGAGWRVKDHDHPLGLFFDETDAKAGKLVLSKYGQECGITGGGDSPDVITYFL